MEEKMIKVILNGCCGKMGNAIVESVSKCSDIEIVSGIDKHKNDYYKFPIYDSIEKCKEDADVIIDFSRPDSIADLLNFAKRRNIPIIICTTGFSKEQEELIHSFSKSIPVFKSSNMSIGINLLSGILKKVSGILYNDFDIEIIEAHHNQKVDSPSGTALMLYNSIKDSVKEDLPISYGRKGISKRKKDEIGMHSIRGGTIAGTHEVLFAGRDEIIEFKHEALSRNIFAVGALKAVRFVADKKPGFYTMDDVISELIK